ncbi:4-nitrophenyl phosphatase, partial [Phenoliferia sp. Uapishka_3]
MTTAIQLSSRASLQETIDKFDVILFDCDGVIWEGDHLIDGAKETLAWLRKEGKRIFFVTNNATKSRAENKKKFDKMGIECTVDEIFSSAYASAAYLKNILHFPADKRVYVIGEKGIEDELDSVGVKYAGGTDPADNVFIDLMDFSSITADPSIGAVLCGLDMHFNYKKVAKAHRYLKENPGCHFLATNMDSTFPTHGNIYPGGGATVAPLIMCSGKNPIVVGKPEKAMMDCILETNHLDKSRTLMVGDRLDTDILFGHTSGISTLMVLTGINSKADFEAEGAVAVPTYVVNSLGDFRVLGEEEK